MDINLLKNLVEQNSYTTNVAGVQAKQEFIGDRLRELGFAVEFHKDGEGRYADLLVAKASGAGAEKRVGLLLHSDTVQIPEKAYEVYEKDGLLYGPGVSDMQAGVFVILEALQLLREDSSEEMGERTGSSITVIVNPCEEKGSPAFQDIYQRLARELDYCLVYESSAGSVDEEDANNFLLATSRKGIFQQRIEVRGPGGHSGSLSQKHERQNAIMVAVEMMRRIDALADYEKETTVNVAFVEGGLENTIIAQNCAFTFDVRFRYPEEGDRVKASIAEIISSPLPDFAQRYPDIEIEDRGYNYDLPALPPNQNTDDFLAEVRQIAETHKLGLDIQGAARGGWSDMCNFYKYNPEIKILDGFAPNGQGEHTDLECVNKRSLENAVQLTRALLAEL